MTVPPKYPRVPRFDGSHLVPSDDLVLSAADRADLIAAEVVVEEKLDGMNVMLWFDGGVPRVGTRGGEDTSDRSGERGRLRAWVSTRSAQLSDVLGGGFVVYGEWLRRRHAVPYDRLPAAFIAFDILDRETGEFVGIDQRDLLLARVDVARPPIRFRGVLGSVGTIERLLGPSAFSHARAEGLVVRTADGRSPRIAKHLDPSWHGIGSAPWAGDNGLIHATASTRRLVAVRDERPEP